jgi:hypothetical protein
MMRRYSNLSIGARLTLWYSLVLLAGLALFGGSIWVVVNHRLTATIDESLEAQATGVATVLKTEYDPLKLDHLQEELSEYVEATPEGRLIEVRDPQGNALVGGGSSSRGGANYRTHALEVTLGGQRYQIRVAASLEGTELTLRRLREVLLWAAPAVLLLGSLGGFWLSRRALAPVDAITRAARTIGIENLSQRLDGCIHPALA